MSSVRAQRARELLWSILNSKWFVLGLLVSLALLWNSMGASAQEQPGDYHLPMLPDFKIEANKKSEFSPSMQLMFFTTSLALIPYLVVTCTAYIRVSITYSYLKAALGSPAALTNQISQGIILMITFFLMWPVAARVHDTAFAPYMAGQIERADMTAKAAAPLREFMMSQIRYKDLYCFDRMGGFHSQRLEDVPFLAVYPAFITSEVKTGFMIGFMIYIPFLVVDMVVAATTMSMGMFQISPMQIAQPFKLMLFCSIEGWHIYIVGLRNSFNLPNWYPKIGG